MTKEELVRLQCEAYCLGSNQTIDVITKTLQDLKTSFNLENMLDKFKEIEKKSTGEQ